MMIDQKLHRNLTIKEHEPHSKLGVNSGALMDGRLVTLLVLLLNDTNIMLYRNRLSPLSWK
jgi:hypothetical protein